MDSVDRLNSVMEVLRRQIAESTRRLDVKGGKIASHERVAHSQKPPLQDVKRRIKERLNAIPKTDPDRGKKAQRLFIESVLAWEFGDELLLDGHFSEILDRVQEGLAAIPDINQQFDRLFESMDKN